MSKQETQDKITTLEQRVRNALDFYHQHPNTLDILLYEFEQLTGAIRIWMGVGCGGCGGVGRRAYGSTATWHGGVGGQAITDGVCDKCWGTGRTDQKGVDLRHLASLQQQLTTYEREVITVRLGPEQEKILASLMSDMGKHRGRQVTCQHEDRTLMGDVIGTYFDDENSLRLVVKYFNGEPWEFDPFPEQVQDIKN